MNGRSRWGYLLLVLGGFALLGGCGGVSEDDLYGIWYAQTSESAADGTVMDVRGTTEYFRNGTTNLVGEVSLARVHQGRRFELVYSYWASGEWQLDGTTLTEKIVDLKSVPRAMRSGDAEVDLSQVAPEQLAQIPLLEDMVPTGVSESTEIVELGDEVMQLRTTDSTGAEKMIMAERRQSKFESR